MEIKKERRKNKIYELRFPGILSNIEGKYLPTFRDNLSVPSSMAKKDRADRLSRNVGKELQSVLLNTTEDGRSQC